MTNVQVSEQYIREAIPHLVGDQASELARVVNQLVATFQPERVYVFGSQARGTPRPDSDIDILVVVPTADEPTYRLAALAYAALAPPGLPVELLFMTRNEFDERALATASLPARVLSEGRLLYAA
jgi:predicted nucleotidyltransferase